jgi:thiol:disulfide interchange protein DsbA
MTMFVRKAFALLAALVGLAFGAAAQSQTYSLMNPPQPTEGGGKIEVVEFFWYGCPHCYALEPEVNAWLKRAPKDVVFKRVPAFPSESWGEAAKVFYTLEAMGVLPQYHQKVFDAIHKEGVNMNNQRQREAWLSKNGIDPAKYEAAEKSFSVDSKLKMARQMTQNYKVDSVPRLVVNGKYYTSAEQAGGAQNVFAVVDQLVDMARRDNGGKTAAAAPTPAAKAAASAKK